MADSQVTCPSCGHRFELTDASRAQLREEFEKKLQEGKAEMWAKAQAEAQKRADEKSSTDTKRLAQELEEKRKQADSFQKDLLDAMKRARELEDREKLRELENAKKLEEERRKMVEELEKRQAAQLESKLKTAQEDERKKLAEKEQKIAIMEKTIDDLKRQAAQGSQQAQGDALENALKERLARAFPLDAVDDVATGVRGADLVQRVQDRSGRTAGTILWEIKNTKAWSEKWVGKLKDDRADAKADVAVLVTSALPKDVAHFGEFEGVWVTEHAYAPMLAAALRSGLLEVDAARGAHDGRETKMEALYAYLASPQFKSRIETVTDAFQSMKSDIDAEKRAMAKHWALREKSLERVLDGVAGMHGELKALMGPALPDVAALELPENAR